MTSAQAVRHGAVRELVLRARQLLIISGAVKELATALEHDVAMDPVRLKGHGEPLLHIDGMVYQAKYNLDCVTGNLARLAAIDGSDKE